MSLEIANGIQTNWRSANFDSQLLLSRVSANCNADLIIEVRAHFRRWDAGNYRDAANVSHATLSWDSDAQFRGWVSRCCRVMESRLGGRSNAGKLWLAPQDNWGVQYMSPQGSYRPGIKCLLRVVPVGAGERKHLWLDCYRVPASYCPATPAAAAGATIFTSSMQSPNFRPPGHYGQLVNVDAWSCYMPAPEPQVQEVAVHELGHFIGLDHVLNGTSVCPASNPNAVACYGTTPHSRGDLEGAGHRVEAWHATPWLRRLTRHLTWSVAWRATTRRVAPVRLSTTASAPAAGRPNGSRRSMDGGVPMDAASPMDARVPRDARVPMDARGSSMDANY